MAFLTLEALDAAIEVIAFAEAFEKCEDYLVPDNMVLVSGCVMNRNEPKPKLRLESCTPLSLARGALAKSVQITISTNSLDKRAIDDMHKCCREFPGDCYLVMHVTTKDGGAYKIRAGNIGMSPSNEALSRLRSLVGNENVRVAKSIS
jgi:DNA polymerase-3 subunit alpha